MENIIIINWIIYCSGTAKNDKTNSSKLTDLNLKNILHIGATFPPFSSRDWIQGLLKARHTLCKWYTPRSLGKYSASEIHPRSFYFLYWDGVSLVAQVGLELILLDQIQLRILIVSLIIWKLCSKVEPKLSQLAPAYNPNNSQSYNLSGFWHS